MTIDLLIKDATVVLRNPTTGLLKEEITDVGIRGSKIVAIGSHASTAVAADTLNARGLHLIPGVIDTQVHFREPGFPAKEDLSSGTMAALLGGVTSVFEMPNTSPPTLSAEDIADKQARAQGRVWFNIAFYVGADQTNYKLLPDLQFLPGSPGIKIFLGSSTGHLVLESAESLSWVLQNTSRRIAFHAEDEKRLVERRPMVDQSPGKVELHPEWRDAETAYTATLRILNFARDSGHPVHILHVTTKQEVELLAKNKDIATFEITPQHLTLSAPECYERLGTLAQMNPPIRTKDHQDALWRAIDDGSADVIGSDHAPHTLEEKAQKYPASPSGMTGVQTLLPVMLNHCALGRLSLVRLVQLTADNPAKIFRIKNKGAIHLNYDADLTLVDLRKKVTIDNKWIASRCGWTPFAGMQVTGWPIATILSGEIVMRENQILGTPRGRLIEFENF